MRIRNKVLAAVVAVAAVATLAACSSSTKSGSSPSTPNFTPTTSTAAASGASSTTAGGGGNAAYCAQLIADQSKFATDAGALANPTTAKATIDTFVADLKALETGAPANVKAALEDLGNTLKALGTKISNPQNYSTEFAAAATKLQADGKTISDYVASSCAK